MWKPAKCPGPLDKARTLCDNSCVGHLKPQHESRNMYLWQEIRRGIHYCRWCEAATAREAKRKLNCDVVYRVRKIEE